MQTIHITIGSGKMAGINSINTSTLENEFCTKMRENDSVCKQCYAARYEKMRPALHDKLVLNSSLLSSTIIPDNQLPIINAAFFRFDSFGEIINDIHLINLVNIVKKNNHCNFGLWTKRKDIIKQFFNNNDKPDNLILIYSSPKLNKIAKIPQYFDKVFTAHNKLSTVDNINCHGNCINCLLCYNKNNVTIINEKAK
jgi:hypothetical protein